jgi:cbb3-type cytochrome oxidase maturation protein
MRDFFYLIPVALLLGGVGLAAFMWSLRRRQYEDLDGAAERILFDEDRPLKPPGRSTFRQRDDAAAAPGGPRK